MEKQTQNKIKTIRGKVDNATTKLVVIGTPLLMAANANAADGDISIGTLAIGGFAVGAAAIFAVKSGPALLMWGYNAILGFLKRG
ncbi:hypothetical protein F889_02919 [Acinetobacter colistiniresistens]|uniref:Uncharacterized protein n=1 Tax=Acinetobacter colistiniresistens TaxID=280145 RepID=N9R6K2_9GAMM|nr:hypothetical protein [Acinetobacter colistiniresistens]ENX34255.1 hypothetical protein F889_02919 [Acinetobacter colistiniresistens]